MRSSQAPSVFHVSSACNFPGLVLPKQIENQMEHEMESAFIEDYRAYYTQGMENQTRENSEMEAQGHLEGVYRHGKGFGDWRILEGQLQHVSEQAGFG